MKSTVSEDVIYTINVNGQLGYFSLSDQIYHHLIQVPIGSRAMAVDKANNVLYYIEDEDPNYKLLSLNLTTLETIIIGPLYVNFTRMDYRSTEGLIYFSKGAATYTYDPFVGRFVSQYKIKHGRGGGDFCFGPDDYLYLVNRGLYKGLITEETSDYDFSSDKISIGSNGLESGQDLATIIVFDNAFDILQHPGSGMGINTSGTNDYVEPVAINLEIILSKGFEISEIGFAPNNPFIFRTDERGREIHLPGYPPTDLEDSDYFGTGNDATNLAEAYYYKTQHGLPWGMNVPVSLQYPLEKESISKGYLKFNQWAASGGFTFMDWYLDKKEFRNNSKLFKKD